MKTRAALLSLCSLSSVALADERTITLDRTCVEIDAETDGLAPADREHAAKLLRQVLERENQLVVETGCTQTYRLSHERTADKYVIRVHSSTGKRRMTTPALDALPDKYRKLVQSLMVEPETAAAYGTPAPEYTPVQAPELMLTQAEAPPIEETLEEGRPKGLWYATLGGRLGGGAGGTLGYRRALRDDLSIDFAMTILGAGDSMTNTSGTTLGGEILKYRRAAPKFAVYGGGGVSLGSREKRYESYDYGYGSYGEAGGGGLHAEGTAGVQIGRATGPQMLVQADLTLPLYTMDTPSGTTYAPSFLFSLGVGF